MLKLSKSFTEQEQELFTETFYELSEIDDTDSPRPWGCPWTWACEIKLSGKTIEEMAVRHYHNVKNGMEELDDYENFMNESEGVE